MRAGLVLHGGDDDFVLVALAWGPEGREVQAVDERGGSPRVSAIPFRDSRVLLRLERVGSEVTAFESPDGVLWKTVGTAQAPKGPGLRLGLLAMNGRPGNATDAGHDAGFEWFRVESPPEGVTPPEPPAAPVANLTGNVSSGRAPLSVNFSLGATHGANLTGWSLDFGDGSAPVNGTTLPVFVEHVYRVAGSYAAAFTVTDEYDRSDVARFPLLVERGPDPVANLTADVVRGKAPLAVNFTVDALVEGNVSRWVLDPGDGSAPTNGTSVPARLRHVYAAPGNRTATLEVTDDRNRTARANLTVRVEVGEAPVAALSAEPASGTAPLTVRFLLDATAAPGVLVGSWTFDAGDGSSVEQGTTLPATLERTYATPGNYTANLSVSAAEGGGRSFATSRVEARAPEETPPTPSVQPVSSSGSGSDPRRQGSPASDPSNATNGTPTPGTASAGGATSTQDRPARAPPPPVVVKVVDAFTLARADPVHGAVFILLEDPRPAEGDRLDLLVEGEEGVVENVTAIDSSRYGWNATSAPNGYYRVTVTKRDANGTVVTTSSSRVFVLHPRAEPVAAVAAVAVATVATAGAAAATSRGITVLDYFRDRFLGWAEDAFKDKTGEKRILKRELTVSESIRPYAASAVGLMAIATFYAYAEAAEPSFDLSTFFALLPIAGLGGALVLAGAIVTDRAIAAAVRLAPRVKIWGPGTLSLGFSSVVLNAPFGLPLLVAAKGELKSKHADGLKALAAAFAMPALLLPLAGLAFWRYDVTDYAAIVALVNFANSAVPVRPLWGASLWRWRKLAALGVLAASTALYFLYTLALLTPLVLGILGALSLAGFLLSLRAAAVAAAQSVAAEKLLQEPGGLEPKA